MDGSGILLLHSVISLAAGGGLYFGLPQLPFLLRDRVLAIGNLRIPKWEVCVSFSANRIRSVLYHVRICRQLRSAPLRGVRAMGTFGHVMQIARQYETLRKFTSISTSPTRRS